MLQAPRPKTELNVLSFPNSHFYQIFMDANKQVSLRAHPEFKRNWTKVRKQPAIAVLTYPERIQMQRRTGWHWRPDLSHCLLNCCSEKCWGTWGVDYTVVFLCDSEKKTETNQKTIRFIFRSFWNTEPNSWIRDTLVLVVRLVFVPSSLRILLLSQMQLKMLKPMGVYVGVVGLEQIVQSSKLNWHADING